VIHDARGTPRHDVHWWFTAVGIACLLLGAAVAITRAPSIRTYRSIDFDLNWVAADRLVDDQPLYDRGASRRDGIEQFGSYMRTSNRGPYSSFIGAPVVALMHAPLLVAGHEHGLAGFRLLMVAMMVAAVWVTSTALPRRSRAPAGLIATGALLASWPFFSTVKIGQANGVLMLAFAVAAVGIARGRWRTVGLALGVAAALKVSPVLIVVYLALRGRRAVLGWAALSACSLSLVALVVGRPGDTWQWIRHVLPAASDGSYYISNQSLVGSLARVLSGDARMVTGAPLGDIHYVAWAVIALGGVALWRLRRGMPVVPLELGAMILLILFAGPLSWDYYFVWAYVPVVLLVDPRVWERMGPRARAAWAGVMTFALMLFVGRLPVPAASDAHGDALIRWTRNPYTLATAILLVVVFRTIVDVRERGSGPPRHSLDAVKSVPVGVDQPS
jgi:alpha-1,2-mannosyltransferase